MRLQVLKIRKLLIALLFATSMLGCTNPITPPPKQEPQSISRVSPIRVIVTFDRLPAAGDRQALQLIAEVCNCTPVFIRQFLNNGAIYEITLPSDMTYIGFQRMLLDSGGALGVRAVEQDSLMHHY